MHVFGHLRRCFHGALDHRSTSSPDEKSGTTPALKSLISSPVLVESGASVGASPSAVRLLPAIDYCPRTATGPLCVRGHAAKKFKRRAPMLWFVAVVVRIHQAIEPACMRVGCPFVWTGERARLRNEGRYSTCSRKLPHPDNSSPPLKKRPSRHGAKIVWCVLGHCLRIFHAHPRWSILKTHMHTRRWRLAELGERARRLCQLSEVTWAIDCAICPAGVSRGLHVLYLRQPRGRSTRAGGVLRHVRRGTADQASARCTGRWSMRGHPHPANARSDVAFDEPLPCGLTLRQLEDLQTRELSAEVKSL